MGISYIKMPTGCADWSKFVWGLYKGLEAKNVARVQKPGSPEWAQIWTIPPKGTCPKTDTKTPDGMRRVFLGFADVIS